MSRNVVLLMKYKFSPDITGPKVPLLIQILSVIITYFRVLEDHPSAS